MHLVYITSTGVHPVAAAASWIIVIGAIYGAFRLVFDVFSAFISWVRAELQALPPRE